MASNSSLSDQIFRHRPDMQTLFFWILVSSCARTTCLRVFRNRRDKLRTASAARRRNAPHRTRRTYVAHGPGPVLGAHGAMGHPSERRTRPVRPQRQGGGVVDKAGQNLNSRPLLGDRDRPMNVWFGGASGQCINHGEVGRNAFPLRAGWDGFESEKRENFSGATLGTTGSIESHFHLLSSWYRSDYGPVSAPFRVRQQWKTSKTARSALGQSGKARPRPS